MSGHLTEEQVERLVARKASPAECRQAVRHLLTGCQRCSFTVGELALAGQLGDEGAADYDHVFDVFERRLKGLLEGRGAHGRA